jgi:hypothetical protein
VVIAEVVSGTVGLRGDSVLACEEIDEHDDRDELGRPVFDLAR